jgi:hypothetical protein
MCLFLCLTTTARGGGGGGGGGSLPNLNILTLQFYERVGFFVCTTAIFSQCAS